MKITIACQEGKGGVGACWRVVVGGGGGGDSKNIATLRIQLSLNKWKLSANAKLIKNAKQGSMNINNIFYTVIVHFRYSHNFAVHEKTDI